MDADHHSHELLSLTHELVSSLAEPALMPFQDAWPPCSWASRCSMALQGEAHGMPDAPRVPSTLAVLEWLPQIALQMTEFAASLIDGVCRSAPSLVWRQSYTEQELGAEFLRGYAYTEIIGPSAPLRSDRLACGFLLLGPSIHYPSHRHRAAEIYVTLSGNGEWMQGDGVWRKRSPGTVIHHAGEEPHAMRTGAEPLLALYLWHGAHLNRKARLDSNEPA